MLQAIFFETDMTQGVKMQRLGRLFASGDRAAHTFKVRVKGADLSGYSADGYMIRATNDTVLVSATVDGDTVIATLPEACYTVPGGFSLIIRVSKSDEQTAVFWGVGTITRSRTDVVVDTEKKIPSLEELLAQIDALNAATSEAKKATTAANDAYQRADTAAKQATTSATSADAAAQRAETAAKGWENDKASDSAKLGGKAPEYYIQPRNLLDNSDFANPVNQRGLATYETSWGMTIDRWYIGHSDGDNGGKTSLTISEHGIVVKNLSTQGYSYIQTRVPSNAVVAGKEYTLAFKRNENIEIVTLISDYTSQALAQYGFLPVVIENRNIGDASIEWVALYEGVYMLETLPPYKEKDYAVEMAECKRYYEEFEVGEVALKSTVEEYAHDLLIQYNEKRIIPTISYSGTNVSGVRGISKSSCVFYSTDMSQPSVLNTVKISADL